jgi:hypothetical protein
MRISLYPLIMEDEERPMSTNPQQEAGSTGNSLPSQENFGAPFPEESPAQAAPDVQPAQPEYTDPSAYAVSQAPQAPQAPQMPQGHPGSTPAEAPLGTFPSYGYGPLPQGAYGLPPYGYPAPPWGEYATPPPSAPLPLGQAIRQLPRQYWRVLTNPRAATFAWEQGKAAWNVVWMQLLGRAVFEALFILLLAFLGSLLFSFLFQSAPTSATPGVMDQFYRIYWIIVAVYALLAMIFVPIAFFISAGIYYLLAKAFGGQGSFLRHCYCSSLVSIPIQCLTIAVSLIPLLGSGAGLAGAIYDVILRIHMTMAVHRLRGGKAAAAVLIPVITYWVVVIGLIVAYYVLSFWTLRQMK